MCSERNKAYNFTKLEDLNYNYFTNFLLGKVTTDPDAFIWNGRENFTWPEIVEFIFDNKKEQEVVKGLYYWDLDNNKMPELIRNIWPYHKCVEYLNYSRIHAFGAKENIDIFLIDPNRFITHRVIKNAMQNDPIYLTFNEEQRFDSYYTIQITAEKLREEEGTCRVYPHQDGFNTCVQVTKMGPRRFGDTSSYRLFLHNLG